MRTKNNCEELTRGSEAKGFILNQPAEPTCCPGTAAANYLGVVSLERAHTARRPWNRGIYHEFSAFIRIGQYVTMEY